MSHFVTIDRILPALDNFSKIKLDLESESSFAGFLGISCVVMMAIQVYL